MACGLHCLAPPQQPDNCAGAFENLLLVSETRFRWAVGITGWDWRIRRREIPSQRCALFAWDQNTRSRFTACSAQKISAEMPQEPAADQSQMDWRNAKPPKLCVSGRNPALCGGSADFSRTLCNASGGNPAEGQLPQLVDFPEETAVTAPYAWQTQSQSGICLSKTAFCAAPLSQKTYPVATELMFAIARRETEFKVGAICQPARGA